MTRYAVQRFVTIDQLLVLLFFFVTESSSHYTSVATLKALTCRTLEKALDTPQKRQWRATKKL